MNNKIEYRVSRARGFCCPVPAQQKGVNGLNKGRACEASEKYIEQYLRRRVAEQGGVALKYTAAPSAGYPDRLVILPGGVSFWCELKSRGKRPSRLQEIRAMELTNLGQSVWLCNSPAAVDCAIAISIAEQS